MEGVPRGWRKGLRLLLPVWITMAYALVLSILGDHGQGFFYTVLGGLFDGEHGATALILWANFLGRLLFFVWVLLGIPVVVWVLRSKLRRIGMLPIGVLRLFLLLAIVIPWGWALDTDVPGVIGDSWADMKALRQEQFQVYRGGFSSVARGYAQGSDKMEFYTITYPVFREDGTFDWWNHFFCPVEYAEEQNIYFFKNYEDERSFLVEYLPNTRLVVSISAEGGIH